MEKIFLMEIRKNGYGGYYYNEKFWANVIPDFIKYYNLKDGDKILILDVEKGFMLFDFGKANPNLLSKASISLNTL